MKGFLKLSIILFSITVIVIFNSCSKNSDNNNEEKKNIAIIGGMNSGYHWGTVKRGAEAASREFNVNIEYSAPNDEGDVEGQIKLANQAIEKDMDALILAPSDYEKMASLAEKAYKKNIPVIIIDSQVNTKKITSYIGTDNLEAGKKAGNMLVSMVPKNSSIAIINFVKGSKNAEEREEGLLYVLSKHKDIKVVDKRYCQSDSKRSYNITKEIISKYGKIDCIVAFNSQSSEGAALAVDEMNLEGKVKIIAFDSAIQEIEFLEKGIIQATIIQNPFSMGYLGVKNAVEAMKGKKVYKNIDTGSKLIDKNNMDLPENQKLLFPFVK